MADERLVAALLQQELDAAQRPYFGNPNLSAQGRRANQLSRAFPFTEENAQKPADPLESFRSLAGLKDAYERRVQPIINNAAQTFSTGGAMGDLLRSYGEAAAPGNAVTLQGMGIPFKGPMTVLREEGVSSGENFRPMGDPQQQFAGQLLGDPMNVQPMVAPAARGAVAAGKYAGPELARGLENYMVKSGGILPMDTWHGSPHRFPPTAKNPLGEFDPTKIGTGEGAQAYGVGAAYLAENKSTATGFRDTLAHKGALDLEYESAKRGIPFDREAQIEFMRQSRANVSPEKAAKSFQYANIEARNFDQNKLATLFKDYKESKQGNLYKVDLPDEQIAKMLDYDKPLSKQSKEVQDALARATINSSGTGKDVPRWSGVVPANYEARSHLGTTILVDPKTGMAVHPNATHPGGEADALRMAGDKGSVYLDELRVALGGEKNVAEFLRKNGISGIRYLDQGSLAGGAGTSNFVVFDPAHMNIIGRE